MSTLQFILRKCTVQRPGRAECALYKQDASIFISFDIRLGGPLQGWIGATTLLSSKDKLYQMVLNMMHLWNSLKYG